MISHVACSLWSLKPGCWLTAPNTSVSWEKIIFQWGHRPQGNRKKQIKLWEKTTHGFGWRVYERIIEKNRFGSPRNRARRRRCFAAASNKQGNSSIGNLSLPAVPNVLWHCESRACRFLDVRKRPAINRKPGQFPLGLLRVRFPLLKYFSFTVGEGHSESVQLHGHVYIQKGICVDS